MIFSREEKKKIQTRGEQEEKHAWHYQEVKKKKKKKKRRRRDRHCMKIETQDIGKRRESRRKLKLNVPV